MLWAERDVVRGSSAPELGPARGFVDGMMRTTTYRPALVFLVKKGLYIYMPVPVYLIPVAK